MKSCRSCFLFGIALLAGVAVVGSSAASATLRSTNALAEGPRFYGLSHGRSGGGDFLGFSLLGDEDAIAADDAVANAAIVAATPRLSAVTARVADAPRRPARALSLTAAGAEAPEASEEAEKSSSSASTDASKAEGESADDRGATESESGSDSDAQDESGAQRSDGDKGSGDERPAAEDESKSSAEGEKRAEGAEGEAEERVPSRTAFAICLMSLFPLIMGVFYLFHYPDRDFNQSVWQACSNTVSIFCAVLMYGSLKEMSVSLLQPGKALEFVLMITLLLFQYALLIGSSLIFRSEGNRLRLVASTTILAHMAGFAAMFACAELQERFLELPGLKDSLLGAFAALLVACLALVGLLKCGEILRNLFMSQEDKDAPYFKSWCDQVEDAEEDVKALALGFLLMQCARFLIMGRLEDFEPAVKPSEGVTPFRTNMLLVCGIVFGACTFGSTFIVDNALGLPAEVPKQEGKATGAVAEDGAEAPAATAAAPVAAAAAAAEPAEPASAWQRIAKNLLMGASHTSAMAMAWSFVFWADWQVYEWGYADVRIAACMLQALMLTGLCFVGVFALDQINSQLVAGRSGASRAIRSLLTALGLIIGLSWERSFDVGLDILAEFGERFHIESGLMTHLLALALVGIMLPGWVHYILPKAAVEG
eukprot:TRINITY_DN2764_c1_g3_i1.p1 TRINITY_DN2764_c1_g3~~TRINITY_DN2764_c1_g3_i1.p1  ORF type:complete len:685 (+),score=148.18 TRINITY_DN2764_c1_g3_i1:99-2057(+)